MILSIIERIAATSSTLEKQRIIKECNSALLQRVFKLAYNKRIKYFIKKRPPIIATTDQNFCNSTLDYALNALEQNIGGGVYSGTAAIEYVGALLCPLSPNDREVVYRILERDLRCNLNVKSINSVCKNLIAEYPTMLCNKYTPKNSAAFDIENGAFLQKKEDGARINLEFNNGIYLGATSRNGNSVYLKSFENVVIHNKNHVVLDGELLYADASGTADRKRGNGIVTKAIRNTISTKECNQLFFVAWDILDYSTFLNGHGTVPYSERFETLKNSIDSNCTKIKIVESTVVYNSTQIEELFKRNLALGYEGAILKNRNGVWVGKRSNDCLKLKAEESADLIIIDVLEGTGKNKNKLGAFVLESSDKLLQVNVGTGFSDAQRAEYFSRDLIGHIVTVGYNQLICNKMREYSLFLPTFECLRYDKTEADTLEKLQ